MRYKLHKHIGLVPAFLLVYDKITHASIRPTVKTPFSLYKSKGAGIKHANLRQLVTPCLRHTPTGDSSDKN